MRRFVTAGAALCAVVLMVTGCSSPVTPVTPSASADAAQDEGGPWTLLDEYQDGPAVRWGSESVPSILLTTYGGSGCPTAPGTLDVIDPSTIRIDYAPPIEGACASNIEPFLFMADQPTGLDTSAPITVIVDGAELGELPALE